MLLAAGGVAAGADAAGTLAVVSTSAAETNVLPSPVTVVARSAAVIKMLVTLLPTRKRLDCVSLFTKITLLIMIFVDVFPPKPMIVPFCNAPSEELPKAILPQTERPLSRPSECP